MFYLIGIPVIMYLWAKYSGTGLQFTHELTEGEHRQAKKRVNTHEELGAEGVVPTWIRRPASTPPRSYIASTFNPGSTYFPFADIDPNVAEGQIKHLNINNRFVYG